jgi:ubiquitin C
VKTINDKIIILEVRNDDTIECLKQIIYHKENIPFNQQHLFFCREELEDGYTVNDYNIKEGSELNLNLHTIQIFVKTLQTDKTTNLMVKGVDTIRFIKQKI